MKLNKEILRLALPNILSNISVPLIASVDTGLMGHLSSGHLAAVGSAAMIFNFLYWNFGFLRMGTTGMVAQAYGKKDENEKSKVFYQAILVAILISILLLVFHQVLGRFAINSMNLEGELEGLASTYFNIRIWDVPATLGLYVVMAWFFGNQNAFIPLLLTIIINLSNIILSVLFVKHYELGIAGVAWGSVIANYVGIISGFVFIQLRMPLKKLDWVQIKYNISRFFNVNRDIFLRTVMLSFSFAFLYSQAATYGSIILGINVIILQFINWMSYAIDGFAYASESMVGKYYGAKDELNARKAINLSMLYGAILAVIFSISYAIFTIPITSIFTNNNEIIIQISDYKIWIIITPILGFASYIWDGVFVGLTASKAMRNTMLFSFIVYLTSYYIFRNNMGYHALLLALSLYIFSRGLAQTYMYIKKGLALK